MSRDKFHCAVELWKSAATQSRYIAIEID